MMRRHPAGALVVAWLLATPVAAQAPDVLLLAPPSEKPVFGQVTVTAEVLAAEPVAEVVFLVDGRVVKRLDEPPWTITVDVGQRNVEHSFEVVARTATGAVGRTSRVTPAITVDERVDLELQQLYVTVTRDGGQRLLSLERDDFRILDNGTEQEMVTFEGGDVPFTAALLVDASDSMIGERLRLAVEGATAFVEGMKALDEASLLLFSDRLLYLTPFTGETDPLTRALASVTAHGGTAINDHLYLALKQLEARQGRRVAILLTDGVDIESALPMEDVLWMARRSQTLIYWIRILETEGTSIARFSSWRDAEAHRREIRLLEQAVEESGGRIVPIERIAQASEVFREILSELREQYVLGYYPSHNENDGSWHELKVKVDGGYRVRTREGYVDF